MNWTMEVKHWLDRVYDSGINGFVTTVNLAEFQDIAIREATVAEADTYIEDLRGMGGSEYSIDDL